MKSTECNSTFAAILVIVFIFMLIMWISNKSLVEKSADEIVEELERIEQRTRAAIESTIGSAVSQAGSDFRYVGNEVVNKGGDILGGIGRFIGDAVDKVKSVFSGSTTEKFVYPDGTEVEEYGIGDVEDAYLNNRIIMVVVDETSEKFHNSYHSYHPYPSLFQDLYLWYPYRAHQPHRKFFRSQRPCVAGKWVRFAGDWIYVAH